MTFIELLWHMAGFVAPAFWVVAGIGLLSRFFGQNKDSPRVLVKGLAINFIVCLTVLLLGLALAGNDGRLLTYGALVLACATVQSTWAARR